MSERREKKYTKRNEPVRSVCDICACLTKGHLPADPPTQAPTATTERERYDRQAGSPDAKNNTAALVGLLQCDVCVWCVCGVSVSVCQKKCGFLRQTDRWSSSDHTPIVPSRPPHA
mmetsp:Transcript_22883/g.65455  ORF Transcript_22883/g.65455 Transcript_22883/m.65455 type:complete len:116 (-) Transcript_22883:479-826(-)